MRQELIDKLINHQKIMDDECFELSIEISRLLNTNDKLLVILLIPALLAL